MNALASSFSPGIPRRTLSAWSSPRGDLQTRHLESIRDELRARKMLQAPIDVERSYHAAHVRFDTDDGRARIQFVKANGLGEALHLTHDGLLDFCGDALPAGWTYRTVKALVDAGDKGRKLAGVNVALLTQGNEQVRTFRTIKMRDGDNIVRAVRAVVSQGYAAYDNLDLVEDLLATPDFRDLPVLSYHETDRTMRLRFLLDGSEPTLDKPVPIVEAWNSETGRRSAGLSYGIWKLICTNGLAHYDRSASYRWRHYGDPSRIRRGISSALEEIGARTSGMLVEYDNALEVAIDDAAAWLEETLGGRISAEQVARSVTALSDETTTPGGLLASVIDAVTLAAQEETSIDAQYDMEREAHYALRIGLQRASEGKLTAHA